MKKIFKTFKFGIITDTHIRSPEGDQSSPYPVNKKANDRARYAVQLLADQNPDFVIHLGDMVHPLPHMAAYSLAAKEAKKIFSPLMPNMKFVPGNHDIGDKPSLVSPAGPADKDSLTGYKERFGEDYYSFEFNDIQFIVMNSSLVNNVKEEHSQKEWLETTLAKVKNSRIFLFSHYPPFINDPSEDSHYDNYAEPGRQWLLGLAKKYNIEAVFSGHVHHFFFNRLGKTKLYCHPATSFTRQDYSVLFPGQVEDEFGRDDKGKYGVSIVTVGQDSHNIQFIQTNGNIRKTADQQPIKPPVAALNLGFLIPHLRHDWALARPLPYNGPMEEFSRKIVRNDYLLLRLMQLGITKVRIPLSDLLNPVIRKRMQDFHAVGISFVIFCVGIPDSTQVNSIEKHKNLLAGIEIVTHAHHELDQDKLKIVSSITETWISKITTSASLLDPTQPFAHTVSCGYLKNELQDVVNWFSPLDFKGNLRLVMQLPWEQNLIETVESWPLNLESLALNVRLSNSNPAIANFDKISIFRRLKELSSLSEKSPELEIMLDTFSDFDRGYHPRTGLISNSSNIHDWLFAQNDLSSSS